MTDSIENLRENTVKKLEANYTHGYINLEKFEKLLELAINTSLVEDLTRINSELKDVEIKSETAGKENAKKADIRPEETFIGFMSGIKRRGKWSPARKNKIYVLMGGVNLDFTEAIFPDGEIDLEFYCLMGGIDIRVPKGINVDISGFPFMGGIDNRIHEEYNPDNPTLRIRGFVMMGGVDVKPSR